MFVDAGGLPLRYIAGVKETFDRAGSAKGQVSYRWRSAARVCTICGSNTFAVRALQGSPVDRRRTGAHMVALATYMGHVNIYATYWEPGGHQADLMPRRRRVAGERFIAEGRQS